MPDRDGGRVSIFLVIAVIGLVAVFGVAVDATGQLRTLARAENLAAGAARTAGQAVAPGQTAAGGGPVVDAELAAAYAAEYLTAAGHDLPADSWEVELLAGGAALRVTLRLDYDTRILGLFGISQVPVTATATAVLVTG